MFFLRRCFLCGLCCQRPHGHTSDKTKTPQATACTLATNRVCLGCSNLVGNATYTGVGTTNATCPWVCDAGYHLLDGLCRPCPADSWCSAGVRNTCPLHTESPALSSSQNACLCLAGYYGDGSKTGTSPCSLCLASSYCPGGNANASVACADNFTSPAGSSAASQCFCKPGYQLAAGACKRCPPNTYCESGVLSACPDHAASPEGSALNTSCACVAGFHGANGQACARCDADAYCTGGTANAPCTAHAVSPVQSTNATACYCDRGYQGVANAACVGCEANTWCWTGILNRCPANSSSPALSSWWFDCRCDPGSTGQDGGPCAPCAQGSYKNATGNATCDQCPQGFDCPQGAVHPLGCRAGTYCVAGGAPVPCPLGSFCPEGVSAPTPCGLGAFANATGSSACAPCGPNAFADAAGMSACLPCPANSSAPAASVSALACTCASGLFMEGGAVVV